LHMICCICVGIGMCGGWEYRPPSPPPHTHTNTNTCTLYSCSKTVGCLPIQPFVQNNLEINSDLKVHKIPLRYIKMMAWFVHRLWGQHWLMRAAWLPSW
jgi:hypothetical protein